MSNLCVIPARGGSKRIPRKNIKNFCGKPIIAYSIEAALQSNCFDKVIVSTDDQEIADIAIQYGAEVPFLRSKDLADDFTGTTAVIADSIRKLSLASYDYDYTCGLYATAPFVRVADLRYAVEELVIHKSKYIFAVTEYPFPIQRAIMLHEDNHVSMFDDDHFNTRSQDLISAWHDAGQFCWGDSQSWLDHKQVFTPESRAIKLPRYRVQDIDTIDDWLMAEYMYRAIESMIGEE